MPNKLSHSQASKFQECAQAWKYWYVDKLRPINQSAALLFGSAVDHALTSMMKSIKDGTETKKPEDIFAYYWRFQDVNGENTYLPTCSHIVYSNSDFDYDLLSEEQIKKLSDEYSIKDLEAEVKKLYDEKEYLGFDGLPEDRKKLLNNIIWHSLYTKGMLMIKAVKEEVVPKIKKVLGVQEYVCLQNEEGDSVIGYADLVCEYEGYDKPVVLDFKTSSRDYEEDAVLTSPQLSLYVHSLSEKFNNTRLAGYIVMHKQVRKNKKKTCSKCKKDGTGQRHKTCDAMIDSVRCNGEWIERINPKVYIQTLVNIIPPQTEDIVLDNFDFINQAIKSNIYPRSFGSCIKPWGACSYYNLCYKGSMDKLIKTGK